MKTIFRSSLRGGPTSKTVFMKTSDPPPRKELQLSKPFSSPRGGDALKQARTTDRVERVPSQVDRPMDSAVVQPLVRRDQKEDRKALRISFCRLSTRTHRQSDRKDIDAMQCSWRANPAQRQENSECQEIDRGIVGEHGITFDAFDSCDDTLE